MTELEDGSVAARENGKGEGLPTKEQNRADFLEGAHETVLLLAVVWLRDCVQLSNPRELFTKNSDFCFI